jgi:hypothetical protein
VPSGGRRSTLLQRFYVDVEGMPNYKIRQLGVLQIFDYKTLHPEDGFRSRLTCADSMAGR